MKIRELFTDESKWTTHAYARTKEGKVLLNAHLPEAVCWCLDGAISKCYLFGNESDQLRTYYMIKHKIFEHVNENPVPWNDHPKRTFAEVKQLVETLDI